jgi:hypothetical protein
MSVNEKSAIFHAWSSGRRWSWRFSGGAARSAASKIEKVPQLPSKATFSKRFEDAVGQACESCRGSAGGVAIRFGVEHGAGNRLGLPGTVGGVATQASAGANADGRSIVLAAGPERERPCCGGDPSMTWLRSPSLGPKRFCCK